MHTSSKRKYQRDVLKAGFSLTEMALVFLVAAAIIAIVSVGSSVVENAKYSNVYGNISNYTKAVEEFYRRYKALPGDMQDVSQLPKAGGIAGNGNSAIDSTAEAQAFWQHLQLAGLIEGDYSGGSSKVPGVDVPVGPFDSTGYRIVPNNNGEIIIRLARFSGSSDNLAVLTAEDAKGLDSSADDGKPATSASRVRAASGSDVTGGESCYAGTGEDATYKVGSEVITCVVDFVLNPYIQPASLAGGPPACPRLGATRVSASRACPLGYPGKVIETCRPTGWTVTDITCSAAICAGEREYVYKDQRVESCPSNYSGAVLRECSAVGTWVDAADQTGYQCAADTGVCSVEGAGRILPCPRGSYGGVEQTCTSGSWATTTNTCAAVSCSTPSSSLGAIVAVSGIGGSSEACDDNTNYRCKKADGTDCLLSGDGIYKACSMTGAAQGQWEIVANSCIPKDYASLASLTLPCDANTPAEVDLGCPTGQIGQNRFRCVSIDDEGATDWEPIGVNTCRPLSCGESAVGSMRESFNFSCPDSMAGTVYEVCNICEDGEPCWSDTSNRGKALWEVNYSNCAPKCSGAADNAGYAVWPNADVGANGVRSASCMDGYFGVAVRNCTSVAASDGIPLHGKWSEPSKSCFLPPFSLTGLRFWVDATNDASIQTSEGGALANNQHVSTWYDMSSNGVNMTNGTDNTRPLYKTSGINGKPALYFDGGDELHAPNNAALGFERTDSISALVVSIDSNTSDNSVLMSKMVGGSTYAGWDIGYQSKTNFLINAWNVTPKRGIDVRAKKEVVQGEPMIYASVYDGSSTAAGVSLYLNGYKVSTISDNDNLSTSMINTARFRLGARGIDGALANYHVGYIGEALIYEVALSDARRRQVEEYLSNKWDIPISKHFAGFEGLNLWLDASDVDGDGDSSTNPSGAIATWYDIGPFRNHATQTNASYRPVWQATGLNDSKPSVSFYSTTDLMTTAINPFNSGNVPYSIVAVLETDTINNIQIIQAKTTGTTTGERITLRTDYRGFFRTEWWNNDFDTASSSYKAGTPYIITSLYEPATGLTHGRRMFVNGEEKAFNDPASNLAAAPATATIGQWGSGDISELMVFDKAISNEEREAIEQYLAAKWGIAIPWTPENINGLTGWWDGDNKGSLFKSGNITLWKDKSDNGFDMFINTSTASQHPIAGSIGNRLAVYFDGGDHIHQQSGADDIGNSAHTMFVVANPLSGQSAAEAVIAYWYCGTTCSPSQITVTNAGLLQFTDDTNARRVLSATDYRDRVVLVSLVADGAETSVYLDGKQQLQLPTLLPTAITTDFVVGHGYVGGSYSYSKANYGEVILYNRALSNAERETVEAYLGNKWPLGESWAPTKIPGLELWLDAADASSLEQINSYVNKWQNKATENASLTHMTGMSGVTLKPNGQNGKSVINFDGSSYAISNTTMVPKTLTLVHKTPYFGCSGSLCELMHFPGISGTEIKSYGDKEEFYGAFITYPHFVNGKVQRLGGRPPRVFNNTYQITTFVMNNPSSTASALYLKANSALSNVAPGEIAELLVWNRNITNAERLQVENYLSEKWNIPVMRPNLNSPAYGLQGLALWLDASDSATIADLRVYPQEENGTNLDVGPPAWANKGNIVYNSAIAGLNNNGAFSAIQSYSPYQPTYQPTGLGSSPARPSFRFDGVDNSMSVPNFSMYATMTAFVVGKANVTTTSGPLFIEHGIDNNSNDGFYIWGHTVPISIRRGTRAYPNFGSNFLGTSLKVLTVYNDATNIGYYANTALPTTQTPVTTATSSALSNTLVTNSLFIGSRNQASFFTNGDFGEILIYDRYLPDSERKLVEDYLVDKWINGVTADGVVSTIGASKDISVWFDAADTTHMTVDGSNKISQLNDIKSPTIKYNALQTTASMQPLYVAGVKNGNGVMRFDGVDDVLTLENDDTSNPLMLKEVIGSASDTEDSDFTIISVVSVSQATENDAFPTLNQMIYGVDNATGNVGLAVRSDSERLVGFTLADGQVYQSTKAISIGSFYITALYQGGGNLYFDVNGANISKQPAEVLRSGLDTAAFMLGGGNSSKPFKGDIGEFIAFGKMLQQNEREQIEQYLSGKWGIPVVTGADGASGFTDPTSVEGLTLWLDADDASTLNSGVTVADGDTITTWDDKSGNDLDFTTNSGTANDPIYVAGALNGRAALKGAVNGRHFWSTTQVPSSRFASNNQISIFQVYRADGGDTSIGRLNFQWESAPPTNRVGLYFPYGSGISYWDVGNANSGGRLSKANNVALQYNRWMAISAIRSPNNQAAVYANGELFMVGTMTDLLDNTGNSYIILFRNNASITYSDFMAELLVYNVAVADADRENIENYLMTKWGIGSGAANEIAYADPSDMNGLRLWLDVNDTASLYSSSDCSTGQSPANGVAVGCIKDKSTEATQNMIQATAGSQPIFYNDLYNGKRGLYFDGTNDSLAGAATLDAGDDTYTLFAVWESEPTSISRVVWEQNLSSVTTGRRGALLLRPSNYYGYNGQSNDAHELAPYSPNERNVSAMIFNNGAVTVSHNGVLYTGAVNATTANLATSGTYIGRKVNNSEFMKGYIHEILVYDSAFGDTDRAKIEAYLANKWQTKFDDQLYARSLAGLRLWLDGSDSSTIFTDYACSSAVVASGNAVGCWKDKSPYGSNVIQSVAGRQPTYITDAQNGHSLIRFDGNRTSNNGDILVSSSVPTIADGAQTYIAVAKSDNVTVPDMASLIVSSGFAGINSYSTYYFADGGGASNANSANTSAPINTYQVNTVTYSQGTTGSTRFYVNGDLIEYYTGSGTQINAASAFQVGGRTFDGFWDQRVFDGDIAEIMVFDRELSGQERQKIEKYLMDKWLIDTASANNSNLTLWFDASDPSTINSGDPADGDAVSTWVNKANNSNIPSVTTYNGTPTFKTNVINGLPALNFGGPSNKQSLYRANVSRSHFANSNEISIFVVQQYLNGTPIDTSALFWQNGTTRINVHFPENNIGQNNFKLDFGANWIPGFSRLASGTVPSDFYYKWHVMSAIKRSNNTANIYKNGVSIASGTISATISDLVAGLHIGSVNGPTYNFIGNIAEMLVYRTGLSEPERVEVEAYLQDKWRLDLAESNESIDQNDLTLWLDASDASTVNDGQAYNGAEVTKWNNKAVNTNIPSLSKLTNGPTYVEGVLNGKSVFSFGGDAADQSLYRASVQRSDLFNSDEVSLFIVQNAIGATSFASTSFWWGTGSANRLNVHYPNADNLMKFDFGLCCTIGTGRIQVTNPGTFLNNWHVLSSIKTSSNGYIYMDGSLIHSNTMTTTSSDGAYGMFVGRGDGINYRFNGQIAELMVYRTALSDSARQEVENYLMNKWIKTPAGKTAAMVKASNLKLWLDGADASSIFTNTACTTPVRASGQAVLCWQDKSGNSNSVTQKTASLQPIYNTNVKNSHSALTFAADRLQGSSATAFDFGTGDVTWFTVVKAENFSSTTKNKIFGNLVNGSNYSGFTAHVDASSQPGAMYRYNVDNNILGGVDKPYEWTVISSIRTAGVASIYVDGNLGNSISNTDNISGDGITVGAERTGGVEYFNGNIAEILIYNVALTESERVTVNNYLMNKWDITPAETIAIANPQTPNSLVLWLDASDSSTINNGAELSDFTALTEWRDKSTNANRAVRFRTTGDSGVRYKTSAMNGYPAMAFDQIPLQIENSGSLDVPSDATWFMVASSSSEYASQNAALLSKGNTETNFRLLWDTTSSKGMRFCSGASAASCANASNGYSNMKLATPYLLTYRYKAGSPGRADFYKKGGSGDFKLENVSAASSLSAASGSTRIMLGGVATNDTGAYTQGFAGHISEVLMYNYYMADIDRIGVENYLRSKWGFVDVPKKVDGLTLWLDASDASTINNGATLTQGTAITSVQDKSENAITMTSGGSRVRYATATSEVLNGKPVFKFAGGTGTGLVSSNAVIYNTFVNQNEMTAFAVMNDKSNSGSLYWWQVGSNERFNLHLRDPLIFDYGTCCNGGQGRYITPSIPEYYNEWWIISTSRKSDNKVFVELDSDARSLQYNSSLTETMAATTATDYLEIGSYVDGGSLMDGYIAEFLLYRRYLTLEEKTLVRRYLGSKWGIATR